MATDGQADSSHADSLPSAPAVAPRGRARLKALLRERNQFQERAGEIDRLIREAFGRRVAVLALDMCGFSRLTASHGICFYLAMIAQMEDAARPAVANNGGTVVKQEADDLFAIFPTPAQALEGALDIHLAFEAVNSVVSDERDIHGSIGIGYGDLLVIEGERGVEDVFGEEMNSASRLGEDLACDSEILLTPAAVADLPAGRYRLEPKTYNHRGTEIRCMRFLARQTTEDGYEAAE